MNKNWSYVPFSQIFSWCKKSTIGSNDGKPSGKYKLFIASATKIKYFDEYLEEGESLIFGTGGNPCIYYVDEKFAYTNHTETAKKKIDNVNLKFYYYYFQKNRFEQLATTFVGGGIKNSSKKKIGALSVPLPDIDEQNKIVAKVEELFSELDKAVDTLQNIKKQLAVYRQAVLKEAFEGKWHFNIEDNFVNLNFKKISETHVSKLPDIPKMWKYVYLSDLGILKRGRSKHRPRNDINLFKDGKYPFFQTGDIASANNNLLHSKKKYNDFGLSQSKLWPAGTLCITIAANIAETCFLGVDGCFPDSVVGFTPNKEIIDKEYVRFFIESSKLKIAAFAPATAQKNINLTTLENLVVPYCNLSEQKYIVSEIKSRLSVCDNIEKTIDTVLLQSEALRQTILKQAFEGELIK